MKDTPELPVVGISCGTGKDAEPYQEAICRNGGKTLLLLPDLTVSTEERLMGVDGLLLAGSENIHPSFYGCLEKSDDPNNGNASVDQSELDLLKYALCLDIPVLGICRGMQILNLVMGGTLIQNVAGHLTENQEKNGPSNRHLIFISPGSRLAKTVGSGGFVRVNSRHQHGIREAQKAKLLMASAYSLDDRIIEALESPVHGWVLGVQFHPEIRQELPPHFERLFQSLVYKCAGTI